MEGKDFERKSENVAEDESAIGDWEGEGGSTGSPHSELASSSERGEKNNEKETFINRAAEYCRLIGGKLMCKVGEHEYEEVGSEEFHGGQDKKTHLRCVRSDCKKRAWTNWRINKETGEYEERPF